MVVLQISLGTYLLLFCGWKYLRMKLNAPKDIQFLMHVKEVIYGGLTQKYFAGGL